MAGNLVSGSENLQATLINRSMFGSQPPRWYWIHETCAHCDRVNGDRSQQYLVARLRELGIDSTSRMTRTG